MMQAALTAGFKVDLITPGPGDVSSCFCIAGIDCKKGFYADAAGLLDLSFGFTNVAISNPPANKQVSIGGFVAIGSRGGTSTVGMTVTASNIFTHAYYRCESITNLSDSNAPAAWGTSTGDMANNVTNFIVRYQFRWITSVNVYRFQLDNPTATYSHNGAAPVALGGALSNTGMQQNAVLGIGGAKIFIGMLGIAQRMAVGYTARIDSFTLHAGRML
jgi:hypothetical protein